MNDSAQNEVVLQKPEVKDKSDSKKKKKSKKITDEFDDALLELESLNVTPRNPLLFDSEKGEPIRKIGEWTSPFVTDKTVVEQFKNSIYPEGEVSEYSGGNKKRITDEEKRHLEKISFEKYNDMRRAAEVHRQVRRYIQSVIRPGVSCLDIVQAVESKTKYLIEAEGLKSGWGFPTGCSLNSCAAHYTPNYGDKTVFEKDDIMKLDFGTHVNGYIIDSAFTIAFDEKYDPLIESTKEATNTGLKLAGIDARTSELGEAIEEVIESFEITLKNRTHKIKPIRNLTGHNIGQYIIHAGKAVPIVGKSGNRDIMEEGDVFAIETFATTGSGTVVEKMDCSHYMKNPNSIYAPIRLKSARESLNVINREFSTLPFCKRWLDDLTNKRGSLVLRNLVDAGIIVPYPPLCDNNNSFTSQMEHTILLRPTCKEVLSRGDDY
ncbi:methionine aminopeptidase, putative [Theileria annulata]|uniref:Methionine aminopeptidase 2 n=1 Tax=Theileria annulata TaxID=5874 RepID=Q4UBJ1_THEAN|nr:methionine aminopeptidase, putative [Theileria annulata]CAI75810.1 methionine aminopeptidase, putative [Theileria annulata]|eukprot:XP_955286.1 methionine aminopeptidase, putative [Theileria annulata]